LQRKKNLVFPRRRSPFAFRRSVRNQDGIFSSVSMRRRISGGGQWRFDGKTLRFAKPIALPERLDTSMPLTLCVHK